MNVFRRSPPRFSLVLFTLLVFLIMILFSFFTNTGTEPQPPLSTGRGGRIITIRIPPEASFEAQDVVFYDNTSASNTPRLVVRHSTYWRSIDVYSITEAQLSKEDWLTVEGARQYWCQETPETRRDQTKEQLIVGVYCPPQVKYIGKEKL